MSKTEINTATVSAAACCGCGACESVCPVDAVRLLPGERGFLVPQIDSRTCIHCGRCADVCQTGAKNSGSVPLMRYGAVNISESTRGQSASGGVFPAIVDTLAREYGDNIHFFGAAWDEALNIFHTEATGTQAWKRFSGSKYVQSRMHGTFRRIRELLDNGQYVLFSGTGCQCAGLKRYLSRCGTDTAGLFIIDIICHGVSSPVLWQDYLRAVEAEAGRKITAYQFRNKAEGWRGMHPAALLDDGTQAEKSKLFLSYGALFGNLSLNDVCYTCKYACLKRNGDITLGDYWGIEHSSCGLDDGKGVSLCLVNTAKGQALFGLLAPLLKTCSITDDSYLQPQLQKPTQKNILCDDFWRDYQEKGYAQAAKKYAGQSRMYRAAMKFSAWLRNHRRRPGHDGT